MAKIIIPDEAQQQLLELDDAIRLLNAQKIKILFGVLGIRTPETDFANLLEWSLILITVPDKQMAVQLNKLSAYVPNLKFVVDVEREIFSIRPGKGSRRIWK